MLCAADFTDGLHQLINQASAIMSLKCDLSLEHDSLVIGEALLLMTDVEALALKNTP